MSCIHVRDRPKTRLTQDRAHLLVEEGYQGKPREKCEIYEGNNPQISAFYSTCCSLATRHLCWQVNKLRPSNNSATPIFHPGHMQVATRITHVPAPSHTRAELPANNIKFPAAGASFSTRVNIEAQADEQHVSDTGFPVPPPRPSRTTHSTCNVLKSRTERAVHSTPSAHPSHLSLLKAKTFRLAGGQVRR